MKTKFFKRLSFVLVVAMVLSLFVPAAGAFAAKAPKLNSTNKYLHLDVDKLNEYNFNVANKQKGWKYFWESANEDVAVVNEKNGVTTATGVGKTKVTLYITNADGEKVQNLSATVTVRDNIKEVTIKNPVDTLAVGEEHDYNRSFVTVSGSTKKTSAITRWVVEPSENASIDDKGVFVATEAGEYTVTALSFQSKARYNNWLKDDVKYADYVLDTDTTKVVVGGSMVSADQVDLDTVNVVFDSAMEDVDKNIVVYQIVGETKIKQTIAKVTMGTENTVATVDFFIPFATGSTYVIEYPEMDPVSFVAATTNAEDVVAMEITTTTAEVGKDVEVEFKLLNANNVNITTPLLKSRVTMEATEVANTWFNKANNNVIIFEKGITTTVTATYHTYKYDTTTGEELGNVVVAGVVIGVDPADTNITGLDAWTIVTNGDPNFGDVKKNIAVDDQGSASPQLFVQLNTKTGNTDDKVNSKDNPDRFEFVSSDDSTLIVSKSDGYLFPVKAGAVTIVVYYGTGDTKTPVATITVQVGAKAAASQVTLNTNQFNLSNFDGLQDSKKVKVTVKDQLGRAFNFDKVKVERISAPVVDGAFVTEDLTTVAEYPVVSENGEYEITFNANNVTKGVYVYRITVENTPRVVSITVLEPSSSEVGSHRLEISTNNVDMKVNSWDDKPFSKSVTLKIVAYSQNGVKLREEALGGDFMIKVAAPHDPAGNFETDNNSNGTYEVVKTVAGVTGQSVVKAPIGSYLVTAYKGATVIGSQSFVTSDTQPQAIRSKINHQKIQIDKVSADVAQSAIVDNSIDTTLLAVVNDALEFKVDGNTVSVVEVSATGTPNRIALKSVKVQFEISTGYYIEYTVNLNGLLLLK